MAATSCGDVKLKADGSVHQAWIKMALLYGRCKTLLLLFQSFLIRKKEHYI
jgi:hypothetical protein